MKKNFLLPHCFLRIGLWMFIPFFIMCCLEQADLAPTIRITMPYITKDLFAPDGWFGVTADEDIFGEIWIFSNFYFH